MEQRISEDVLVVLEINLPFWNKTVRSIVCKASTDKLCDFNFFLTYDAKAMHNYILPLLFDRPNGVGHMNCFS